MSERAPENGLQPIAVPLDATDHGHLATLIAVDSEPVCRDSVDLVVRLRLQGLLGIASRALHLHRSMKSAGGLAGGT